MTDYDLERDKIGSWLDRQAKRDSQLMLKDVLDNGSSKQKDLFKPFMKELAPYKSKWRNDIFQEALSPKSWDKFRTKMKESGYSQKTLGQIWRKARRN